MQWNLSICFPLDPQNRPFRSSVAILLVERAMPQDVRILVTTEAYKLANPFFISVRNRRTRPRFQAARRCGAARTWAAGCSSRCCWTVPPYIGREHILAALPTSPTQRAIFLVCVSCTAYFALTTCITSGIYQHCL